MLKVYSKPLVTRVSIVPAEAVLGYCKLGVQEPIVGLGPNPLATCCDPNGCKDQGS